MSRPVLRHVVPAAKRGALLFAVWLAVTGAEPGGLVFGLAAAALATLVSLRTLPPAGGAIRPGRFAALWPGFILRSIRAGADVAWRALHPKLPVHPGWIELDTSLAEGPARTLLGAEISLLPGTLSAGTRNGRLRVHALDDRVDIEAALRAPQQGLETAFSRGGTQGGDVRDD